MKKIISLISRYLILVLVAVPNLYLFYLIFTPLTIYPVYFLLDIFYEVSLSGVNLVINGRVIELAGACVAGSAYYLLLILNLSTPKIKRRAYAIIFSFLSLLIFNIFRIFIFSVLYLKEFFLFEFVHNLFWYFVSIIFVFGIWVAEIRLFRIREIPFYSDIKYLIKLRKK